MTMDPIISICQRRANPSASRTLACSASSISNGVPRRVVLEQHFGKRAALEIGSTEPLVEDIEDREQLLARGPTPPLRFALQPRARPQLLTAAKEREREVVLRRIVSIQRHLCHAGVRNDGIDSHRPDAVAGKQLIGGSIDAPSRADRARSGSAMACREACAHVSSLHDETALYTTVSLLLPDLIPLRCL